MDVPHSPADAPASFATVAEPAPLLTIGVTGHRLHRLGGERVPQVRKSADEIVRAIEAAAGAAGEGGRRPAFRLVTALADGADTIYGEAALDRGWLLDVVLPFAREDYLGDFAAGAARETYRRLLDASRSAFELHEPRIEAQEGIAYERAGRLVLAQSDILVAVWDNGPVRGRGGAAQIVAEAVLQGIPVIHVDPTGDQPPRLLWDGLQEHDLGQQTVESVPRGDLGALPQLTSALLDPPRAEDERAMLAWFQRSREGRRVIAFAYPLLLALLGVCRPRLRDFRRVRDEDARPLDGLCGDEFGEAFGRRIRSRLVPRFARADAAATHFAQIFRSGYVTNFTFAALAVLLTLLGLALPAEVKPALILLELSTIAIILGLTRAGRRRGWHRRWLDARQLAERLRCLAVSAQLGELRLRTLPADRSGWVDWYVRATAREIGLPSARVDRTYLACCRSSLSALIDDQIAYLETDARRMHRVEHRLHLLGTGLFASTALTCVGLFLFELGRHLSPASSADDLAHPLLIATTIVSAALPALGAAIYGIRMQGDFAGSAERSETLRRHLLSLRSVMEADTLDFDTLRRRALRAADLLTTGLGSWLRTYHARPLSLPG